VLGFTQKEKGVLLFLIISFVCGIGVYTYRSRWAPLPKVEDQYFIKDNKQNGFYNERIEEVNKIKFNGKLSINHATSQELKQLPGIGPVIAERIILFRKQKGTFHSLEDLLQVKGIGAKTFEKLKPLLIID
jgi:competence protein ComEA